MIKKKISNFQTFKKKNFNSLNTYPPRNSRYLTRTEIITNWLCEHIYLKFFLSISNISLKNMSNYYDIFRTRELHKGRVNIRLHMIDTFNTISPPGLQNIGMENRFPGISYIFSQFVVNIFLP